MAKRIRVGDVVRLKSGGPKMTVNRIAEPAPTVSCIWFLDHSNYGEFSSVTSTGEFDRRALIRIESAPKTQT